MRTIPDTPPQDMLPVIESLRGAASQDECLRQAYDILTKKYEGNRLKTITRFFELFPRSMDEVWKKTGFQHCTNLNWLLRTLLVKSGHFEDADIETRWTLLWCVSPHQFVQVRMKDGQRVFVDVWAAAYGIPFGDRAHGLHAYRGSSH